MTIRAKLANVTEASVSLTSSVHYPMDAYSKCTYTKRTHKALYKHTNKRVAVTYSIPCGFSVRQEY